MVEDSPGPLLAKVEPLSDALAPVSELMSEAVDLAAKSRSASTLRVYQTQWQRFEAWGRARGMEVLPAEPGTLVLYLTERHRKVGVSSLGQALAAIAHRHRERGLPDATHDPAVRRVYDGICRERRGDKLKQATPLLLEHLRDLSRVCNIRDRALLVLGWTLARRRSELVQFDLSDVTEEDEGLKVVVRWSKTDQLGEGETLGAPSTDDPLTCPVRTLRAWLEERGVEPGPLFTSVRGRRLSGEDVSRVMRRAIKRAGYDPDFIEKFSAHSLRSGFATTAAKNKKDAFAIAKQGSWKSLNTVRRYVRDAELFENNAAKGLK